MKQALKVTTLILFIGFLSNSVYAQGVLTFEDVMKFEDIKTPKISYEANWLAYGVWPYRCDGYALAQHTKNDAQYRIELGSNPIISNNELWVAAYMKVRLAVQLTEEKKATKQVMSLVSLQNGNESDYENVRRFEFSNDGNWLAMSHYQSKEIEELKSKNKKLGTEVTLINLKSDEEFQLPFVTSMAFDSLSNYMAYSVVDTNGSGNGLFVFDFKTESIKDIERSENGFYTNLTWDNKREKLAFTSAKLDTTYYDSDAELKLWNASNNKIQTLVKPADTKQEWALRSNNSITFTHDGKRLYFGLMDQAMADVDAKSHQPKKDEDAEIDIYDVESIIKDRGMDLWHGQDPLIKTQEKVTWNRRKNHLFTSVYHLDKKKWVQLADHEMPSVRVQQSPNVILGNSNVPYQIESTWDGSYNDWYVVDLNTGKRDKFLTRLGGYAQLSPEGKYAAYYDDKDWFLYDIKTKTTNNLTQNIDVPFYDEDHDFPSDVPGYGIAGWIEKDEGILIYDKFDIWNFSTKKSSVINITGGEGRKENRIFRIKRLDDKIAIGKKEKLLLTSYHDLHKNFGFYSARANKAGVSKLLEEDKKFTILAKAEDSENILFTRQAYDEYPNLWISDNATFKKTRKITQLHKDLKEKWNWGKAELVDWLSLDGTYMQGVVIKPDNYDPNKRYPIMTYYYRFFTNRLHDFDVPTTNHRPVFAQYVSDDYVVFLPDIRFEIGRPGFAATKSLVPGIQKLVELGIADKDKLGLHGHSWSGYQTAFIVTQTNIFAAAVSGAPVSNMTSAYSGIRWESGRARQFQYEKTQSRIGESLIEAPEKYIENSPVFFADKITTPMLIQHGDADGAVPWEQSIELYLAMRRYNKDVVFLQYHNEPHHLQKFSNKLDYAIRMKEYFDYYLKGIGEPEWIISGEPYLGK